MIKPSVGCFSHAAVQDLVTIKNFNTIMQYLAAKSESVNCWHWTAVPSYTHHVLEKISLLHDNDYVSTSVVRCLVTTLDEILCASALRLHK